MKKFLVRLVILLLALLVVLYLVRNFVVRKSVEVGVQRVTGFPLEIGGVDVGLFSGTLEVNNLKLMNPPEFHEKMFVDLPQFKVDYLTMSMLRRTPHIKEMVVNVNEVVIVKNEKGISNANQLQAKVSPPGSHPATSGTAPATEKKAAYRVDLLRVHIGTVITKDYSRATPTERKLTLNQDVTFKDINESTSISALVANKVFNQLVPVVGDVAKGASQALKGASDSLQKSGSDLFDNLKKAVPQK